ncbi:MAG: reverse transcriptase domain-containing protein [Planktothrix sp.]
MINPETLLKWLGSNTHICLVDIGCGSGAVSIAFVETILRLQLEKKLKNKVFLYCLAIDLNEGTLAIYNQLMLKLKNKFFLNDSIKIELQYNILPRSIRESVSPVIQYLTEKREDWKIPCLQRVFMINSTVVDLLYQQYKSEEEKYKSLSDLGVDPEIIANNYPEYSREYALAYKQILEEVAIDNLSVITIGTNRDLGTVQEMSNALGFAFESKHHTERVFTGEEKVNYENPWGSFFRDKGIKYNPHPVTFSVDITTITSASLQNDQDWNNVINLENLELAWVRVRHNFIKESIADEIEIRLFQTNLESNLSNLQKQLVAYIREIAKTDDTIAYKIPKNSSTTRPRMLSRMEEEILGTAIIQKLGHKIDSFQSKSSFAYRLARTDGNKNTEYLYEPWFGSYFKEFLPRIRQSAQKYRDGIIIKLDIKSYYMNILQPELLELATLELRTKSARIQWLLKLLLSRNFEEHEVNRGLSQGGIGSGFWANLYLSSVDARFGSENQEWDVKYYRYADDIILLVPNPENAPQVVKDLEKDLEQLGLSLNPEKTLLFDKVDKFLEYYKPDNELDDLQKKFDNLLNPLWKMNSSYREKFRQYFSSDEQWNYFITLYNHCLESLNIYVSVDDLSRKIYKHLFSNPKKYSKVVQLNFADLPLTDDNFHVEECWLVAFTELNSEWMEEKNHIRERCKVLFLKNFAAINEIKDNKFALEKAERSLRFSISKLAILGYDDIKDLLVELLCKRPWVLRSKISGVMEYLARQGHHSEIREILSYYAK